MKSSISPAAQAVLDASMVRTGSPPPQLHRESIAAALRAAADQVVPEEPLYGGDQRWMFERDARQERRKKLLAIASELDGATRDSLQPNDLDYLSEGEFQALAPQGYHGV